MTGLQRAFLAVVPPPEVLRWTESVADSVRAVDDGLRWTRPDQRHVTVRFLGGVEDPARRAESFTESFLRFRSFTLSFGDGGAFPDPRRASVLWLGVRQGRDVLADLAATVADPEARPFRAHVTLARAARPRDVRRVIAALAECGESDAWTVDEVVLFDSDGSAYTEHARFRLAG